MNSWNEIRLEDIIEINPNVNLKKGMEYPFIDIDKVTPNLRTVTNAETKIYDGQGSKFCKGDTVLSRITPCLENRKIAQINIDESGFGSTEFYVFRAKDKIADPDFTYYLVSSDIVVLPAINSMSGASGRQRADKRFIQRLKIKVPDLSGQRKIANVLTAYDYLIELNNKQIKVLEQMAENLYKEWFVRFRFPGHETAEFENSLPKGWKTYSFSAIANILSGGTPNTEYDEYYNGEIPFYTPKDSTNNYYTFDTLIHLTEEGLQHCNSPLYPKNTIMITARGTVGNLNLLAVPMAMNQSCYALNSDVIHSQYFLFFLAKNEIQKLKKVASGGVFDTIIVKTFDHIKVSIPTDNLIMHFDRIISPIMEECYKLLMKNRNLTAQRDLLLPRLMSGKLEV